MSLVDDAPHNTDIAMHEMGVATVTTPDHDLDHDRPADSPRDSLDQSTTDHQADPDRTSDDHHDNTSAADGDVEMTTSAEPNETTADDTAATDSGKENRDDKENGHGLGPASKQQDKDTGGVKKILKSGVFGGQCELSPGAAGRRRRLPSRFTRTLSFPP